MHTNAYKELKLDTAQYFIWKVYKLHFLKINISRYPQLGGLLASQLNSCLLDRKVPNKLFQLKLNYIQNKDKI